RDDLVTGVQTCALPICYQCQPGRGCRGCDGRRAYRWYLWDAVRRPGFAERRCDRPAASTGRRVAEAAVYTFGGARDMPLQTQGRSEEHTSELQSPDHIV